MQGTSALWKQLWAGGARLEAKAVIAGTDYTGISNPVVSRALTQDGLSIGNAVSATCRFSVRTDGAIPRGAEVVVRIRLADGAQASEWLDAGTFYVAHRSRDPVTGLLTLECYDALLKSNAQAPRLMPWTSDGGDVVTTEDGAWVCFQAAYPRDMASLAADLALTMGVEIDPRTAIATGSVYRIDAPEAGTTINDLLRQIAAANGGNWIMTPANRLRLVPVVSAAGAASAQSDVIEVGGITGGLELHGAGSVTGIRYQTGDAAVVLGDETGIVVDADVGAAVASELYDGMVGMTYQAYSLTGAIYDPAAELGDYVRGGANGEVSGVLYGETATLGAAFRGDICAPEPGELADEYPYIGGSVKTLAAAKAYADQVTGALSDALDQEGVFDRLTGDGAAQGLYLVDGQLYVNMSYARSGTLKLGGLNNTNGLLEILDAAGDTVGTWDNAGIDAISGHIGNFDISGGALQTGLMDVGYNGAYVGTDGVAYNNLLPSGNTAQVRLCPQGVELYWNGDRRHVLFLDGTSFFMQCYDENDAMSQPLSVHCENSLKAVNLRYDVFCTQNLYVTHDATVWGDGSVTGDLTVGGTKSRRVSAGQYADRLLYCYETPSPMFGDVGEGVIGEDGLCYVALDAVFAQTIATEQYQVFLQAYGDGDCRVRARRGGCFIVQGAPGLAFGWEIKAKQRDYDQRRLDGAQTHTAPHTKDYGAEAAQYVEQLKKEREAA